MTASEIAFHFGAKKTGRGAWSARCTAHDDRNASLSIREGKTGVLLRCWSQGCDVRDICKSAGLTVNQLFYGDGRKLDPKARAEMQRKRAADERKEEELKRRIRYWTDETRKWETVAGLLFAHLVRGTDCAGLWHKALTTARSRHERLREYWPLCPEVETYRLWKIPKEITRSFVGNDIAGILGL